MLSSAHLTYFGRALVDHYSNPSRYSYTEHNTNTNCNIGVAVMCFEIKSRGVNIREVSCLFLSETGMLGGGLLQCKFWLSDLSRELEKPCYMTSRMACRCFQVQGLRLPAPRFMFIPRTKSPKVAFV